MPLKLLSCLTFACLTCVGWPVAIAQTVVPMLKPLDVPVSGRFTDEDGKLAQDISGIACAPESRRGAQRCLVINDEDHSAQSASLKDGQLVAGPRVPLFGKALPATTRGSMPAVTCRTGEASVRDLDGEAVSYAAPYFYIAGSNGCSRNGKWRASIFLVARLRTDEQGRLVDAKGRLAKGRREAADAVDLTHRLAEALAATPRIGAFFGKDLDENGVNVEGMSVVGDTLYAGLRAPSLDGHAFIVATSAQALFDHKAGPAPKSVLHDIPLGRNVGVRDLASLPDGRLLVLYGSAQDQPEVAAGIATFDPANGAFLRLGELPSRTIDGRFGKAEAILPIAFRGTEIDVLILYDSLDNGMPQKVTLSLQ